MNGTGVLPSAPKALSAALTMAEGNEEGVALVVPALSAERPCNADAGGMYGMMTLLRMAATAASARGDKAGAVALESVLSALGSVSCDVPGAMRALRIPADLSLLTALNFLMRAL